MSSNDIPPTIHDRLDASHSSRKRFEDIAYMVALSTVMAFCIILLFGIAFPPPTPNTVARDWGASIVSRANTAWPDLLAALGALGAWLGLTLGRGAYDVAKTPPPA